MKKQNIFTFLLCLILNFSNAQISFQEEAANIGLAVNCGTTYLGNGVTFCDFDQDGWDDITIATGSGQNILFYKNINGNFVEHAFNFSPITYQTKQTNWVDFDNDGDKDLFVTSDTNGNRLFLNQGNYVLLDITVSAGLPVTNMYTYGASWGDYNNDGFLDVFISNRDDNNQSTPNFLYKNNGDGTFTDVSVSAGILNTSDLSFCSAFFDYNNDGWQDIYVSNDKLTNENVLYKNNGDGTFDDVSVFSGTNISIDAMTVTIGDFNNDSWQDIYVTNGPGGNALLKNNSDGTFTDIAVSSGTIFNSIGWGSVFLDADNDMDIDLYVSGSLDGSLPNYISAAFYENLNNETFNIPNNIGFVNDTGSSYSNAIGDINNDGYPEIVVSNNNYENMYLWKNNSSTTNSWLKVNLQGVNSNRDGIGSKIEISINGSKQYRYTHCGEGYLSQNSATEIFGLGNSNSIDYLKVTWLSGIEDMLYNVSANQTINVLEGSNTLSIKSYQDVNVSIYPNPVDDLLHVSSKEEVISIRLFNILGQKITVDSNLNVIDVSKLKPGHYFLSFYTSKGKAIRKFIKE